VSSQLRALYQQVILDHNRSPRNRGGLPEATHRGRGFNPLCGDDITMSVRCVGDQVEAIRFEGKGCAICTASSSCLTEVVHGMDREAIGALGVGFDAMVRGDATPESMASDPLLQAFGAVAAFPSRVKCAILPWRALDHALRGDAEVATSEE
jgi:nitrogen fixation NifU-like protein